MSIEESKPKAAVRVTQKGVYYDANQDKYLIVKSAVIGDNASFKAWYKKYGPWDLPGGHLDAGEDDILASFRRELLEETGVEFSDDQIVGPIHSALHHNDHNETALMMVMLYMVEYKGEITLSDEHEAFEWLSYEEIQEHKEAKPWIKRAVEKAHLHRQQVGAHDNMLRVLAEFDNYKKRSAQQQKDFTAYASENVISDMLPVLDNFHAATEHIPEDQQDSPWLTGIMYIQKQMEKVFEDAGVSEIDMKVGDAFDPATMEALEKKDGSSDDDSDDTTGEVVTRIVQKGYKIKEKMMRPARVEVS